MARFHLLIIVAAVIQLTIAIPIIQEEKKSIPMAKATDPAYRLPQSVTPKELEITITPNMDTMTFTGETIIRLEKTTTDTIKEIYLHSKFLNYSEITLTPQPNPIIIVQITEIDTYDFLFLNLSQRLLNNTDYTLTFKYTGALQKDMKGFYQSYYKENGFKKWLGTTQFQPGHARKAFPCFDEPGYKSVYRININCPKNYTCISNMKVMSEANGLVKFHPTPIMSSYLIAFIVSQFKPASETIAGDQFRVWARPDAGRQGSYAFDIGQSLVNNMSSLMGVNYYTMGEHMKMDQAAIPDYSFGAMENWGLLTYREDNLMYDSEETSTRSKQHIAELLAHEISHMWFGDYVTCKWWSEAWLNEGFASYWQYYLTNKVDASFRMEDQFTVTQLQIALLADTSVTSSPLTNPDVNSPDEVSGHFGTITYSKGASVIRMIEHWIGYNSFIAGLNAYLKQFKYSNVVPEDLFQYLQDYSNITSYGATIDEVMGSFTRKNGYPIVDVSVDHTSGTVTLTQKRFTDSSATSNNLYMIPITFTTKNQSDFTNTKPAFIMKNKQHTFQVENPHEWIILNLQQTGFYRVSYDDSTLDMLLSVLKSSDKTTIHRYNRAQIVDDAMNLAREGHISYSKMLNIIDFLDDETDYEPWAAALVGYSYLRLRFGTHEKLRTEFDKHILSQMDTLVKSIGLESTGNNLQRIFRSYTLQLACDVGHEECISSSVDLFRKFKLNGTRVDPDLREHVYCNGLREGEGSDFDFLWNKYQASNVVNDQVMILGALGCTSNQEKVLQYLLKTIEADSDIKDQDRMTIFYSALGGNLDNVQTTYEFVMNNLPRVKAVYGSDLILMFISVANRLNTESLNTFENRIESSNQLSYIEKVYAKSYIASVRQSMEWVESKSGDIFSWLNAKYNSAGSTRASFTLLFITLSTLYLNM